jgi:hypothetical protein
MGRDRVRRPGRDLTDQALHPEKVRDLTGALSVEMTAITPEPSLSLLQVLEIVLVSRATGAGVPFARSERTVSDRPVRGSSTLSWQWSRSPSGIWLEIAPSALSTIFALDERTRRLLQSRLFAICDLATVHPVPGPTGNLIVDAGTFVLRYSLDLAGKRLVIEGLEEAGPLRLGLLG